MTTESFHIEVGSGSRTRGLNEWVDKGVNLKSVELYRVRLKN